MVERVANFTLDASALIADQTLNRILNKSVVRYMSGFKNLLNFYNLTSNFLKIHYIFFFAIQHLNLYHIIF